MKWIDDLKNGVVNVDVLLGLDAFEREHEQDSLELGKLKVSGKHDAQLEEKVKQQTQLAKQLEELKKKHGIKTKQDEKKEEQRKQLEEEDKKIKEMREEKSKKEKEEKNQAEKEMQEKKTQEEKAGEQQEKENAVLETNAQQQTQKEKEQEIEPNGQQEQAMQNNQQIGNADVKQMQTIAQQTQTAQPAKQESAQPMQANPAQQPPAPIVKVIMPEEKERDEIPPEGFVYKLVQGRRVELVRIQDEQQFNENEKKVNAANQELQKARIRGERTKARELEQVISDGIGVRESIVQKAKDAQK